MNRQILLQRILARRPTPKQLFLSLISSRSVETLTIAQLIRVGALFGIEPGAARMAAARLLRSNLFASPARGVYAIGPGARPLSETARGWAEIETRLRDWPGGWLALHVGHLGRSDRTALRARERAFRLNGFAELEGGLWVRPDNFAEPASATLARLRKIGLEPEAVLIEAAQLHIDEDRLRALWPRAEIENGYDACMEIMHDSRTRLDADDPETSAREAFLIGEFVIRQITSDPLLPAGMINETRRSAMVDEMVRYNRAGEAVIHRLIS